MMAIFFLPSVVTLYFASPSPWTASVMQMRQMKAPSGVMSGLVADGEIMGRPALSYLAPAAMVAPENMWPSTTTIEVSSMNFWATSTACFGSPRSSPSSSETWPPLTPPAALSSSMAISAPAL